MTSPGARRLALATALCMVLAAAFVSAAPGTKTITFADLMKFRAIGGTTISDDGTVLAYGLQPNRGDGEAVVHALATGKTVHVPLGGSPVISGNARFVAMTLKVPFAASEKTGKDKPKPGMALVDVGAGTVTTFENVDRFAFSEDSRWLAYHEAASEARNGERPAGQAPARGARGGSPAEAGSTPGAEAPRAGSPLKLRDLSTGAEREIASVASFAFDPASKWLAVAISGPEGKGNGVFLYPLGDAAAAHAPAGEDARATSAVGPASPGLSEAEGSPAGAPAAATQNPRAEAASAGKPVIAAQADKGRFETFAWAKDGHALAFLSGVEKPAGAATLTIWDAASKQARQAASSDQAPKGWTLPIKNELAWSKDGQRLFFGFKPPMKGAAANGDKAEKTDKNAAPDPYDFDAILSKVEGDVWHGNDPRIIPQQKVMWNREKDRTYRAVLHVGSGKIVQLGGLDLPDVQVPENAKLALATSDVPYLKETTWGEGGRDVFVVSLETGERTPIVKKLNGQASMSPDGRYVAYFDGTNWRLFDTSAKTSRVVTAGLKVILTDEEHDTPDAPPAYGLGGWVDDGASLLVYDRYDIWRIPTAGGEPVNLTGRAGRTAQITFRVVPLERGDRGPGGRGGAEPSLSSREPLLLTAYHNREKNWGFYAASFAKPGVERRLDEKKIFKFIGKAKSADLVLYSREDYGEFPDVWASDLAFRAPKKISDANPQIADFAWGTAELVDYKSLDGVPLQGVLIKPAGYVPGKRYPVITYFYERESQLLYAFNEPVVNHRPSFAVYAGAGYAIFLPDVVFTIGHPGQSFVKCLVPAVQKLVDMGVADPKKLGLHGHSWGGYGTAYMVTQTNMFAAAVAGAPVANMTSAYDGIRWESGIARQAQYEKSQSRIGGSLWEKRDLFIENSPLFFVDRVKTPVLIEHGDEDGAVPWYQGIEFYLSLRREGKDVILLQYRGEPHHLQKYPNKLDYSIKMKQWFDHYLKGEPAADWIVNGQPYTGR